MFRRVWSSNWESAGSAIGPRPTQVASRRPPITMSRGSLDSCLRALTHSFTEADWAGLLGWPSEIGGDAKFVGEVVPSAGRAFAGQSIGLLLGMTMHRPSTSQ
jgi:hypothetical protein